jgi:flagellar FliL protein
MDERMETVGNPPAAGGSKVVVILLVALIAAIAAAGGAYWFAAKQVAEAKATEATPVKPKGPPIYVEFDPPFVVNFEARGAMRFLQVSVKAMTRDPATAELIKQHDPVIRNDLLMLLSGQSQERLISREGKEELRTEALGIVAGIIEREGGAAKNVEQLYFTSFVMQ